VNLTVRKEYLDRSIAVEPDILLESPVWQQLVASRESAASAELSILWDELRKLESDHKSQASNVH
jgi:hypothetical protein